MVAISRLVLGSAQFGTDYGVANKSGKVPVADVHEILSLAKANGINFIDTAVSYGCSEKVLGELGVDGFSIITKLPPLHEIQDDIDRWVSDQVSASLARLREEKLYGLLVHRPSDLMGSRGEQLIEALLEIKGAGVIQKIGISIYNPGELDGLLDKIKIDLVQAPLNVIDRRLSSSGWLDHLKNIGIEVHTRSTFLQGLLIMDQRRIPQKFSRWMGLLDEWHERLKVMEVSPLAASLVYPLSLNQVDRVIVGVDSTVQLSEILQATIDADTRFDTSFMCSEDLDLINPSNWGRL